MGPAYHKEVPCPWGSRSKIPLTNDTFLGDQQSLLRGSGYGRQLVICRFTTLVRGYIKPTYRGYNPGYYPLTKYPEPLSIYRKLFLCDCCWVGGTSNVYLYNRLPVAA